MRGFKDMRIVVAGEAAGIGAAVVRRLVDEGAKIVVGHIDPSGAERLANELSTKESGRTVPCWFDLSDEGSINALVKKSVDSSGRIDGLVNMTALVAPDVLRRDSDVLQMDPSIWKRKMEVNLVGFGLAIKAALPHMIVHNHGAIVNICWNK